VTSSPPPNQPPSPYGDDQPTWGPPPGAPPGPPPASGGYGSSPEFGPPPGAPGGYGQPTEQPGYGAPGAPGGYGPPSGPPTYGPPPGQPGYGSPVGPGGYGSPDGKPPKTPGTDGFAIAGFITAFFCGLVSVVLCIVALSRIKRSGQGGKGLAIAGLVITALSVAVLVASVVAVRSIQPERDASGRVTDGGTAGVTALKTGDCLASAPQGMTTSVNLVPCTGPHKVQVVTTYSMPAGAYPGESEVKQKAEQGCIDRLGELNDRVAAGELDVAFLYPLQRDWSTNRDVHCLVMGGSGAPLTEVLPTT
jgi:hypothetical protein